MTDFAEGKVKKGGINLPPTSARPNIKPSGQGTTAYLQTTGPLMCFECGNIIGNADVIQGHKPGCRLGELYHQYLKPTFTPKRFPPQAQGEQCGRCWQNHTPGFVCACGCHIKLQLHPVDIPWDNGDDLDAPRNKDVPKKPWC